MWEEKWRRLLRRDMSHIISLATILHSSRATTHEKMEITTSVVAWLLLHSAWLASHGMRMQSIHVGKLISQRFNKYEILIPFNMSYIARLLQRLLLTRIFVFCNNNGGNNEINEWWGDKRTTTGTSPKSAIFWRSCRRLCARNVPIICLEKGVSRLG